MMYYTIQPPRHLSNYIQYFWILEGDATPQNPYNHRVLADICPEFIFYYKGSFNLYTDTVKKEKAFKSGIYGQCKQYTKFETGTSFGLLGIYMYPYALPELFSLPANELSNKSIDIKTLCGIEGEILEEKIFSAVDNIQRTKLVISFLERRLKKVKNVHSHVLHTIKHIINNNELTTIDLLSKNCALSTRQLERKFYEYSGFNPQLFLRLNRFNFIIKKKLSVNKPLIELAYDNGYYDQPHFNRDFKEFSGYTPGEYFQQKNEELGYRVVRDLES